MTDNPESAGTAAETPDTPNSEPSQTPPASPTSGGQDVGALVKAILSHPDYLKDKQSMKDVRFDKQEKRLDAQDEQIAQLARVYGIPPEKIIEGQRQLEYEQNMAWIAEQRKGGVPDQKLPGSNLDLAKARDTILNKVGLNPATPGVDEAIAKIDWSDPVSGAAELTTWAVQAKANTPQPTAADKAPMSGGPAATGLESMTVEQLTEQLALYQKEPVKYAKERDEIMKVVEKKRGGGT